MPIKVTFAGQTAAFAIRAVSKKHPVSRDIFRKGMVLIRYSIILFAISLGRVISGLVLFYCHVIMILNCKCYLTFDTLQLQLPEAD